MQLVIYFYERVRDRVHNSMSLVPTLSQVTPVHILLSYTCKVQQKFRELNSNVTL
jgi:hypothetical protein